MRRRISIFGSTGSIGANTVDLVDRQGGAEAFEVVALSGAGNIELLASQARSLHARYAVTANDALKGELEDLLAGTQTKVLAGPQGLVDAAGMETDWAMSSIVGAAGLAPTLALAQSTGMLALANKESLVCAGELLLETCAQHSTTLMPVDSEHSAIFQALQGEDARAIERIIITASGGPFRTWSLEEMETATREQALAHPNWEMGERITIDSASMFNKALEVIEAKQLFDVRPDQIEVVIHPQSIIHSMVGFEDGAVMAQLGPPDMRGPIGYALNYPDRSPLPVQRLDLGQLARLDFEPPDPQKFPALRLARDVMEAGGACGAVFNAAKEVALDGFLAGDCGFLQMAEIVEEVLVKLGQSAANITPVDGINAIFTLDKQARHVSRTILASKQANTQIAG